MKRKLILILFIGIVACKSTDKQEPNRTVSLNHSEYKSELAKSENVRLIDSILELPIVDGDMSTFAKSEYGLRDNKIDSLRGDLLNKLQTKLLTLQSHDDYRVEADFVSNYPKNKPNYYQLYREKVVETQVGCAYPIAVVKDISYDGYENVDQYINLKVENPCDKSISSIVILLDFETSPSECKVIKRMTNHIKAFGEATLKIKISQSCSPLDAKAYILEFKNSTGETIKTMDGTVYQISKSIKKRRV